MPAKKKPSKRVYIDTKQGRVEGTLIKFFPKCATVYVNNLLFDGWKNKLSVPIDKIEMIED
jgi:hypothetical protein